jgi:hypothetical protein
MDPAMTIFREAAGSSLSEGPTLVSVSPSLLFLFLSCSLARSFMRRHASLFPSFHFALLYERRYRHLVLDYREGTRAKDEEEPANMLPSRFY